MRGPRIESGPTEMDQRMMDRALELAQQAGQAGEVPIGAVVYRTVDGQVLSEGANRRQNDREPAAHAEFDAIQAAARAVGDWRLNDCTLVVTLEPCVMCSGLIINARIGRVIYGARDPKAGAVESLYRLLADPRQNHRCPAIGGVRGDRCARILKDFFSARRAEHRRGRADG